MIKLYNNILPIKGFKAMNLFGILLIRKGKVMTDNNIRHEQIHTRQMCEMLFLPFYLWYVIEWLVRLIIYRDPKIAYKCISFEQEAYKYEGDINYLSQRKLFTWVKYLRHGCI